MKCPRCGTEHKLAIERDGDIRGYACLCGHTFRTIERLYHEDAAPLAREIIRDRITFHGEISRILESADDTD